MISIPDQNDLLHLLEEIRLSQVRLEGLFRQISRSEPKTQEWYSTEQVAKLIERSAYTVREWCRNGRMLARKRPVGRGNKLEWEVSSIEVERFRNHGLRAIESDALNRDRSTGE